MESGGLFNSGFLGAHFNWWIGQIVDDSTWRDNIKPSKFEGSSQVQGWGRRYKVAIIGLHDQEEETIPSDQLPWAQVMYPVTAGGGQASASATPNLRQGNFVFGFFLDGADQQVPVIMGVLGNNIQTKLETRIGNKRFVPTSGTAKGSSPDPNIKVPDKGLSSVGGESTSSGNTKNSNTTIEQPDNPHQQSVSDIKRQEIYDKKLILMNPCDMVGSALKAIQTLLEYLTNQINKYLNAAQSYIDAATNVVRQIQALLADIACQIAKFMKIIFDKIMEYIMKTTQQAMAPTVQTMTPNQRNLYVAIKDTITQLIHCLYNSIIDNLCGQIQSFLEGQLNTTSLPTTSTSTTPTTVTTVTDGSGAGAGNVSGVSLGTGTTGGGTGTGAGIGTSIVGLGITFTQTTPICTVEKLTGAIISNNMGKINDTTNKITQIVDGFLVDMASEVAAVATAASSSVKYASETGSGTPSPDSKYGSTLTTTGTETTTTTTTSTSDSVNNTLDQINNSLNTVLDTLGDASSLVSSISSTVSSITGSIMSALSFQNITLNIFGCDLSPKCPSSDYYTLQEGGGGADQPQQPRLQEVDSSSRTSTTVSTAAETPYAVPSASATTVVYT